MGVGDLFEFVSLPERKTFRKKELARCLSYFGRFYHLLISQSSRGQINRESLRELSNLIDRVEDACYIDLSDVEVLVEEAYKDYLRGNVEEARYKVQKVLGKVTDSLGIFGEFV